MSFVPTKAFTTKGVGRHKDKLTSFEMALRNADIAPLNLVRVSSIFPPHCKLINKEEGLKHMAPGQIAFCVMSEAASNESHRLMAASVGMAIPKDATRHGYISEHHAFGQRNQVAGDYAEDLAASMLATILGYDFDPDLSWDEKKEIWKIGGKIFRTKSITQSATGGKNGIWTTVLSCVVFIQ
ncbi:MAG: arginine decarboxylase, pyruvoyl-dependent [Pseudomonadota bacterium]